MMLMISPCKDRVVGDEYQLFLFDINCSSWCGENWIQYKVDDDAIEYAGCESTANAIWDDNRITDWKLDKILPGKQKCNLILLQSNI